MKAYIPVALYFFIAVVTQLLVTTQPPDNPWGWFRWGAAALLAGLITVKAKISPPDSPP